MTLSSLERLSRKILNVKTDQLNQDTPEAAAGELQREVVARKPSGKPDDHVIKTAQGQDSLRNSIDELRRMIRSGKMSADEIAQAGQMINDAQATYE